MNLASLLRDPGEDWPYAPGEMTTIFGVPANPTHPLHRRIAYGLTAVLVETEVDTWK